MKCAYCGQEQPTETPCVACGTVTSVRDMFDEQAAEFERKSAKLEAWVRKLMPELANAAFVKADDYVLK